MPAFLSKFFGMAPEIEDKKLVNVSPGESKKISIMTEVAYLLKMTLYRK